MKSDRLPLALFLAGLFLVPISAGYVSTDLQAMDPGSGNFPALFGSMEAPMAGHWLPSLFIASAFVWTVARNRVVQVPFPAFAGGLFLLAALAIGSALPSSFRAASFQALSEFLILCLLPFAALAVLGRNRGPILALGALVAGTAVIGLLGIWEYATSNDPSWRVFCNWVNPNAAAGMLGIGFVAGIGSTSASTGPSRILAGAATLAIGVALFLTQSKGGILCALGGAAMLPLLGFIWVRGGPPRWTMAAMATGAIVASYAGSQALVRSAGLGPGAPASALGRFGTVSSTQEQSVGFRILCWKSAVELITRFPTGTGIGTFRYESARPGLIPQTHHAHQGFLQHASETGALGGLALLGTVGIFLRELLRGLRRAPPEAAVLAVTVLAALAAAVAHNLIDSDLQVFGTGAALFLLMGIGLAAARDGATPEYFPPYAKAVTLAWPVIVVGALTYYAYVDTLRSQTRGALQSGNRSLALDLSTRLMAIAPNDPEAWSLAAQFASSQDQAAERLRMAAALGPSMRNLRQYARAAAAMGRHGEALAALTRALERDPNNLPAMALMLSLHRSVENWLEAERIAERLVATEESSAYRVRAIPDSIPTQTLEARIFLASRTLDAKRKARLLSGALAGYREFAIRTIPQILFGARHDPNYRYAGDGLPEARSAVEAGRAMAAQLRQLGPEAGVALDDVEAAGAAFDAAAADLAALSK